MKYRRLPQFHEDFEALPQDIQELTREKFKLFRNDPTHKSLRIKKMKGYEGIWEGHITKSYVFTFIQENDPETGELIITFRRIGLHSIYKNP